MIVVRNMFLISLIDENMDSILKFPLVSSEHPLRSLEDPGNKC